MSAHSTSFPDTAAEVVMLAQGSKTTMASGSAVGDVSV
jgi:hypothetical protein